MDKGLDQNQQQQKLARKILQQPKIESANVFSLKNQTQNGINFTNQLQIVVKQPDYVKNKTFRLAKNYLIDENLENVVELGMGPPLGGYVGYQYSPSGTKAIAFKEGSNGKEASESQVIELVVDGGVIAQQITVPEAVHGKVFLDGFFGCISWDSNEDRVLYVAQVPKQKGPKLLENALEADKAGEKGWKGVAEWTDDWGEAYAGAQEPATFLLDFKDGSIQQIAKELGGSSGQPIFAPKDEGVVFTHWPSTFAQTIPLEMKLGLLYCTNRLSSLYYVPLEQEDKTPQCLTSSIKSAVSPRFSLEGDRLVFLANDRSLESGTHLSAVKIKCIQWNDNRANIQTIVGDYSDQNTKSKENFPGIYCTGWNQYPFIDNKTIVMTMQIRCDSALVTIDIDSGSVTRLTPLTESFSLLQVTKSGHIFAYVSSPTKPNLLAIAKITQPSQMITNWRYFKLYNQEIEGLDQLTFEVVTLDQNEHPIQLLLLYKKGSKGGKGILGIHGGPHTASATLFSDMAAFLALQGYCIVQVNYRGSFGYGVDFLEALPGHIGTVDVEDCMLGVKWCFENGYINADKCSVMGGSHGGFLTGHLMGQYPETFKCGVLRNPVCDLSLMIHVTDIPDWCYTEAFGVGTTLRYPPSKEDFARLFEVSPIAHVDNVKAPMLFMLGRVDQRVPWIDSKRYISVLRARGNLQAEHVKVILFDEDRHALDLPKTQMQQMVEILDWFKIHCP